MGGSPCRAPETEVHVRIVGIIPARWGSTRLPGKPLVELGGQFLIERVWRRAARARCLTRLLVATDDRRILRAVEAFGGEAVLTPRRCATGTDRLARAARGLRTDIVVNVQGDEPFLRPADLERLVAPLREDDGLVMSTLAAPLPPAARRDPNAVKVVVDRTGFALYFSRAPIPHVRAGRPPVASARLHLGLYAYRAGFLQTFAAWPRTPLERAEQLEQLRALEHGVRIRVVAVPAPGPSVDTAGDLAAARRLLAGRGRPARR